MTIRELLCAAPHCRAAGSHATDCHDDTCPGCVPRRAADGLRLCLPHRDRIATSANLAAQLHGECGLALIPAGSTGRGGINPQPGLDLSDRAAEARTLIRHRLVSWSLLISEERGISLPGAYRLVRPERGVEGPLNRVWRLNDSNLALGAYIATHATWLAAHGAAADASDELDEAVTLGRRAAYPEGMSVVKIGACPIGDDEPCPGTLRALLRRADALLPSAVQCDADETHAWSSAEWIRLGRQIAATRPAPAPPARIGSARTGNGGWPSRLDEVAA